MKEKLCLKLEKVQKGKRQTRSSRNNVFLKLMSMPPLLFNFLSWQNYSKNFIKLLIYLFNPLAPALHIRLLGGFANKLLILC